MNIILWHNMSVSFSNDVIYHVVCQINMSDLMMNVHKCVTDYTTYTMFYVRSLCLIINDECTHTCVADNTT